MTLVITSGISIIEWMIRGVLLHLSGSHPQRKRCPRGSSGPCHVDILQKPRNTQPSDEAKQWEHFAISMGCMFYHLPSLMHIRRDTGFSSTTSHTSTSPLHPRQCSSHAAAVAFSQSQAHVECDVLGAIIWPAIRL